MKIILTVAAALAASTVTAIAGPGNSGAAKGMVEVLTSEPGIAAVAPMVSGKNASVKGESGWGNAGSSLFGDQVSKSGKP